MNGMTKSGLYYPNRLVLATFNALIDVMGENGLKAILNYAHLREFISQYPPDTLEREIDFADFSAMQRAILEMYGEKGGQAFIKRAGRTTFSTCLQRQGALAGVSSEAFSNLPIQTKLRVGLPAMARILSQISNQTPTVEEDEACFRYIVQQCPDCWGRMRTEKATCFFGAGLLEEGLKWISGGREFQVTETKCMAKGDETCEYSINKIPIST
jgi:predicted hydrocarbon binding protein